MHYIICLVGPSGSGKSAIMSETMKALGDKIGVLRSTTTRPRRSAEDDIFYRLISKEEFDAIHAQKGFADRVEYAGNLYGFEFAELDSKLKQQHLLSAVIEEGVTTLINAKYPVKIVKIIPKMQKVYRGIDRLEEDLKRAEFVLDYDLEIQNSFAAGGLEKATKQLVDFIEKLG